MSEEEKGGEGLEPVIRDSSGQPLSVGPGASPPPSPAEVEAAVDPGANAIHESPEEGGEILAPGLYVYLGTTQMGKTYKALADAWATQAATRQPILIIDSQGARNFKEFPHTKTVEEVVEKVWAENPSDPPVVVWTPGDDEEGFDSLMDAAREAGHLLLLVDEVSFWASNPKLRTLFRVWAHAEVTLLVTAQNVGTDLAQPLLACNPRLFLFRVTGPRTVDWALRYLDIPPTLARGLPPRHYLDRRF